MKCVSWNFGTCPIPEFSGRVAREGSGREGGNSVASFLFQHAGVCHQGQRPKKVEATISQLSLDL